MISASSEENFGESDQMVPFSSWTKIYHVKNILEELNDEESNKDATEASSAVEVVRAPLDLRFDWRIRKLLAEQQFIQYQLAYLSTLGGAYHLCNKPHVALVIAARQELVGRKMNSFTIIVRARVFQAVNMRLLGKRKRSKALMKSAYSLLDRSGLDNLRSFVTASHQWLDRNYGKVDEEDSFDSALSEP
eukprot:gene13276-9511_t